MPSNTSEQPDITIVIAEQPDTEKPMICPECEEPARLGEFYDYTYKQFVSFGDYVHATDGEPLCPIMGTDGYRPCEPVNADLYWTAKQDVRDERAANDALAALHMTRDAEPTRGYDY